MQAYLVRVINNRMIVGFFRTETIRDLHYWVDTVTDPGRCEYRAIESGGIVWHGTSPAIPAEEDHDDKLGEENAPASAMKAAELTESWGMTFYKQDAKRKPMGPMQYGPIAKLAAGDN